MAKKLTIAIDGFSSCGKSTLAKAIAENIGYIFIDTGAMYRGIALYCIENSLVDKGVINEDELIKQLDSIELHFEINLESKKPELILNNNNVESKIRTMEVSSLVSKVATIEKVRKKLVSLQRKMGQKGGVVMDGRDIGSVVFPNAELKLFITSDPKIRAERRFAELKINDPDITIEEVSFNLKERDYIDSNRAISPLIKPEDAVVIDNTHLTKDEQLNIALSLIDKININKHFRGTKNKAKSNVF